jgi:hypothetical protein
LPVRRVTAGRTVAAFADPNFPEGVQVFENMASVMDRATLIRSRRVADH